ncbi:MAG: L,D-transpeptidase [Beijerinckiaceae bacterium]
MHRVRVSLLLASVATIALSGATTGASAGNLGGGFIEALATGFNGPTQRNPVFNRPTYQTSPQVLREPDVLRQPQVAYYPPAQAGGYAPDAEPVQRTISPEYLRTEVDYPSREKPGTIVVDTPSKHLYLVLGNGRAMRYGIGVGRPGFTWAGVKTVSRKAEWPDWTPPPEMLKRRPDLPAHMEGGPGNPLGARALYLGSSLYRIHGTNEPWTIGQNVSSGCIRMMNEDVTDLYGRVGVGTKVLVL